MSVCDIFIFLFLGFSLNQWIDHKINQITVLYNLPRICCFAECVNLCNFIIY